MPTDVRFKAMRPCRSETPACHARCSRETNCLRRPSRPTRKCDETLLSGFWKSAMHSSSVSSAVWWRTSADNGSILNGLYPSHQELGIGTRQAAASLPPADRKRGVEGKRVD